MADSDNVVPIDVSAQTKVAEAIGLQTQLATEKSTVASLRIQLLETQRQLLRATIMLSQYQLGDVEQEILKCQQPAPTISPSPATT